MILQLTRGMPAAFVPDFDRQNDAHLWIHSPDHREVLDPGRVAGVGCSMCSRKDAHHLRHQQGVLDLRDKVSWSVMQ